jgi:hypothetical protein
LHFDGLRTDPASWKRPDVKIRQFVLRKPSLIDRLYIPAAFGKVFHFPCSGFTGALVKIKANEKHPIIIYPYSLLLRGRRPGIPW